MKTAIVTVYSRKEETFNAIFVDGIFKEISFINEFNIGEVAKIFSEVKMFRVSATEYKNKKKIDAMVNGN